MKSPELLRAVQSEEEEWQEEEQEHEEEDAHTEGGDHQVQGYRLFLSETLQPHVNQVFSNRISILGMPGMGKSNAVAVFMEELGQYDVPIVVFDHKPEYMVLLDQKYLLNSFRANANIVTPQNAFAFGQQIMEERLQVVLDLRSYKNDNAAAEVMIGIIDGVTAWEEDLANDDRVPCTFVLDEAHYWLPESEQLSTVSRLKDKTGNSLFNRLQQTFFNLVNAGRWLGLGTIISTQRPANVDKRVIAVAEWRYLLKATMPNDLKVYREFGVDAEMAMRLSKGQAYVLGPGNIRGVHQMRLRVSPDESKSPGVENLKRAPSRARIQEQTAHFAPSQAGSVAPSVSPSQASGVPLRFPPSDRQTETRPFEGPSEAGRRGDEGVEGVEGAENTLSERENRIGEMFFNQGLNPSAIVRQLYPDLKGGDKYTQRSAEVNDAVRKYVAALKGGR
jgi:hypothetical protein